LKYVEEQIFIRLATVTDLAIGGMAGVLFSIQIAVVRGR